MDTQNNAAAAAPKAESAKVLDLRKNAGLLFTALAATVYGTPEHNAAKMELYKAEKLIEAQIAEERKAEAEQKAAEARNARIALRQNYGTALLAANAKGATQADKDALAAAELALDNALLPNHKSPAKTAEGTGGGGTKGATSEAIKASLLGHIAAGKTITEAKKLTEAEGFSRGTTGAVATAMIKAGEITV